MTSDPIPHAPESAALAKRLLKVLSTAMDWAGTVPAKEAVKLRPADWHAVEHVIRDAAAALANPTPAPSGDEVADLRAENTGSVRVAPSHGNAEGPEASNGFGDPASGPSDGVARLRAALQREIDAQITMCAERDSYREALFVAEARVKMLEEALGPFADEAEAWDDQEDGATYTDDDSFTDILVIGDLRRARAALSQHQKGEGHE